MEGRLFIKYVLSTAAVAHRGMIAFCHFGRIVEESVVSCCKVLYHNSPEGTEKGHGNVRTAGSYSHRPSPWLKSCGSCTLKGKQTEFQTLLIIRTM
jgi:hypothetical protein